MRCFANGCVFDSDFDFDFEIDPGFEFDLAQGFALRAAHQNDLRWRRVPVVIRSRQVYLGLAQKKAACCDAARYLVLRSKLSRIIVNQA